MKFLNGLFSNKSSKAVIDEIELLRRRIDLLDRIITDYRSSPTKYQRLIVDSTADAFNQMVIDKTKLEMQYLYLTKFH